MRLPCTLMLSLSLASAVAQQAMPLRSDSRKLLELLPKGPADITDARTRCSERNSASDLGSETAMAAFNQALQATQNSRTTTGMTNSQEELMQKMQDPAFQEEMKKMSPQDIAQLMQQMQGGSLPMTGAVSDEETALAEEFERLNGEQMTYGSAFNQEWAQLSSELEEKRKAEGEVLAKEIDACPWTSGGETGSRDPICVAAANKRYVARMEIVLNAWLPKASALVERYRADVIKRYEETEKRLVALDYGNNCGTQMFLDMVVNTQSIILGSVEAVGDLEEQIWFTVCREKDWLDDVATH